MVKKISDVLPRDKKTIRHIPLPGRKRRAGKKDPAEEEVAIKPEEEEELAEEIPVVYEPHEGEVAPRRAGILITIASIVVIAGAFFVLSVQMEKATVSVTPKSELREINAVVTAWLSDTGTREILFEKLTLDREHSVEISADGERQAERKASGKIVIYNNFSSAPQRLIQNTRFETPTGLIFRIPQAVTVPGTYLENGKQYPGSVEVVVEADKPGPSYNVGLVDFTIPGFKNDTERYKNFYARSKTPIAGGFSGIEKYATAEKTSAAEKTLSDELKATLKRDARTATPEGYILFDNATIITVEPLTTSARGEAVVLSTKGTLTGFLFKKSDLDVAVAKRVGLAPEDADHRVAVSNTDSLAFTFQTIPTPEDTSISFKLEGSPNIVWKFDEARLKSLLAGKKEDQAGPIIKGFVSIEKGNIVLRPFWKKTFPKDPADIEVVIQKQ